MPSGRFSAPIPSETTSHSEFPFHVLSFIACLCILIKDCTTKSKNSYALMSMVMIASNALYHVVYLLNLYVCSISYQDSAWKFSYSYWTKQEFDILSQSCRIYNGSYRVDVPLVMDLSILLNITNLFSFVWSCAVACLIKPNSRSEGSSLMLLLLVMSVISIFGGFQFTTGMMSLYADDTLGAAFTAFLSFIILSVIACFNIVQYFEIRFAGEEDSFESALLKLETRLLRKLILLETLFSCMFLFSFRQFKGTCSALAWLYCQCISRQKCDLKT